jgi:hypothetical protein
MKTKELIKILQKIPDAELWVTGEVEFCKLNPENIDYDKARNIFWFDAVGVNSPEPEILELMKEEDELMAKGTKDAKRYLEGYWNDNLYLVPIIPKPLKTLIKGKL